jgi:UDP-2,3-diacylglucosamine pyrophosphatase LpxH
MRALAISDLHFGAWTADPLLRHDFALEALDAHLQDIDELVLLGDLFDLLFSSVEHAFAQAEPFFALLQRRMQGKRVVFLAGNHDHHIVVRDLRTAIELKVASGEMQEAFGELYRAEHRNFFQRFLDRRLEGVESRIVYPTHRVGDVLLSHGHYLDAHMRNSFVNRALTRSAWTVAGGRPEHALEVEDYEAVIVPLTELLFTVAQLPRGTAAQQSFYAQCRRLGRLASLPSTARRALDPRRGLRRRNRHGDGAGVSADFPGIRACDPAAPQRVALDAYAKVVRNLGWDRDARHVVFAHTHQPLNGVCATRGDVRYWNTGSWVYEPPHGSTVARDRYLRRAWPGTAVLVDTDREEPTLIEMLADRNPLHGHPAI